MQSSNLKKIVSYVLPLYVETSTGQHNNFLEVVLSNGRYILNSEKTNYSFGSLFTIFQKAFDEIEIGHRRFSRGLVLGLGGGSVMYLLQKNHKLFFPVDGIEIDQTVIDLGNKYFNLNQYKDLNIINSDAYSYVKETVYQYDLIIIDTYINDEMPEVFHTKEFILHLKRIVQPNGIILFNKMLNSQKALKEYDVLLDEMKQVFNIVNYIPLFINGVENRVVCVNVPKME